MTDNITALSPVVLLDVKREQVKARVLDLMRSLGSDGRNVLSRRDFNNLMWWLTRIPTMGAGDLASFVSVENDFRKRFGKATMRSATADGEAREGRERLSSRKQQPVVKKAAPAAPATTATGPNVVALADRRARRVVNGGWDGPDAA